MFKDILAKLIIIYQILLPCVKILRGMWREKFLFYLTLVFIVGNLSAQHLFQNTSTIFTATYCATALIIIILLSTLATARGKGRLLLFIPIFFLMGNINFGQTALFGDLNLWEDSSSKGWIIRWRTSFDSYLTNIIAPQEQGELSILKALTTGDKKGIPYELKQAYSASGAMHLLALSGMHVGLIYGILSKGLTLIIPPSKGGKVAKGGAITIFLLFFALFTGASPSICRAVLMVAIYELGGMLGREKNGINALSISALIITLLNPSAPSSISFQLSYSAMLGIFFIHPHLKKVIRYISDNIWCCRVWEMLSVSISCQILTTPLTIIYFKSFATASLFANILAMPMTTIIMGMISLSLVTIKIPFIGEIASTILLFCIKTLNTVIEIISFF